MKRLFSSLREKHQDFQERKRIDTEMLRSIQEQYGFDIEIKDFQRQFDEFLSSYDTEILSSHLKIYLSKLNHS